MQASLHRRRNIQSEYVPRCTQPWGWSSNDPTCKTTAAKFTKCLEFRSVYHLSLAQTKQRQPVCTSVESGVQYLLSLSGLSFIFISRQQKIMSFLNTILRWQTIYSATMLSLNDNKVSEPRDDVRVTPELSITNTIHTFHDYGCVLSMCLIWCGKQNVFWLTCYFVLLRVYTLLWRCTDHFKTIFENA